MLLTCIIVIHVHWHLVNKVWIGMIIVVKIEFVYNFTGSVIEVY